jgi:hypothetical protein
LEQWGEEEKETIFLKKLNSMEDLMGNEENGYPAATPTKQ